MAGAFAPVPGTEPSPVPGTTLGQGPLPRRSPTRGLWDSLVLFYRILSANLLSFIGFVMVVVLVGITAAIAINPALLPDSPNPWLTGNPALPPSLQYPFGTDEIGVNVFSNVMAALPVDLSIALFVSFLGLVIGGALGIVAGFWDRPGSAGAAISTIILRATDLFLAFPPLVLALATVAVLGPGVWTTTLAILFTWWPFYVRLVRGEVIAVKHLPYITAARASGVSETRIVLRHVLRNILDPLVVYFTLDIGTVIITLSTISYIGVGVPYGIPEWGNLLAHYQPNFTTEPWAVLSIGFMIFVTVLAFSLLGDGLRDVLDPRSRRILAQGPVVSQTAAQAEPELSPALPAGPSDAGIGPAPTVTP